MRAHSEEKQAGMSCAREAYGRSCLCILQSSNSNTDFGLLAPLPPVLLSAVVILTPPSWSSLKIMRAQEGSSLGYLPGLFEPPRI